MFIPKGRRLMEKRQVLVVDDNVVNQILICKMIEKLDLNSDVAFSGEEAIRLASQKPYDLIFMDIQMPGMDGYQAAQEIRKNGKRKDVPIVAVTAHVSPADEEKCYQAGMDGYLAKPLDAKQLFSLIERLMAHKPAEGLQRSGSEQGPGLTLFNKVHQDLGFMKTLLDQFKTSIVPLMDELQRGIEIDDFQVIYQNAHSLKGLSGAIEAHRAVRLLEEIEYEAKLQTTQRMIKLYKSIECEFNLIIEHHQEFISGKSS